MTSTHESRLEPVDVSGVQPEAREILRRVATIWQDHLGTDLHSLVAHGSAVKGGLILGSSDVDYMAFVDSASVTAGGELPHHLVGQHQVEARTSERGRFFGLAGRRGRIDFAHVPCAHGSQ